MPHGGSDSNDHLDRRSSQSPRPDSPLFGEEDHSDDEKDLAKHIQSEVALLAAPAIPGLFYTAQFLSSEEQLQIIADVAREGCFDASNGRNQAVFFASPAIAQDATKETAAGLPQWLSSLLSSVEQRVKASALLDIETLATVFKPEQTTTYSRQCILNLYAPGQGIKPHIDIPHRFLDGIVLLSFGSGISMDFVKSGQSEKRDKLGPYSLYLQPGSLCILTGEARWQWTHGIAERRADIVTNDDGAGTHLALRDLRLSITARWLMRQPEAATLDKAVEAHLAQADLRS